MKQLLLISVLLLAACGHQAENLSSFPIPSEPVVDVTENCHTILRDYSWTNSEIPDLNFVISADCKIFDNGEEVGSFYQHVLDWPVLTFRTSKEVLSGKYFCTYVASKNNFTCPGVGGTFTGTALKLAGQ